MGTPEKVEVKTTVAGADVASALSALRLSLGDVDATTSLVVFCDAPDGGLLPLSDRGLIVRVRWRLRVPARLTDEVSNDVTVKHRPQVGDPGRWKTSKGKGDKDKFEGDWSPFSKVNSFSRRVENVAGDLAADLVAGELAPAELLSDGQLVVARTVFGGDLPDSLRALPPVLATTWEVAGDRTVELWSVSDLHFLEISERAEGDLDAVQAAQLRFVERKLGVAPLTAATKTSLVLAALTG